jgi:putative ABC transport system permease protein
MGWSNLDRRKGRTALTVAGVIVGVAALVLMVSLGLGLQRQVLQLFESDEALKTLTVRRLRGEGGAKKKNPSPFPFQFDGQMLPITEKDLEEVRAIPGVALALPDLNMILRVSVEGQATVVYPVDGIAAEEEARYADHLVHGTMWKNQEEKACLLPTAFLEMRVNLKAEEVIGRKISFTGLMQEEGEQEIFTVVGVIDTESFGFQGRQILMPMDRALELRERKGGNPFFQSKKGSYLAAKVKVGDPRATDEVAGRLRAAGYSVLSANDLIRQINLIFLILESFLASIGAIGLVVALFGIANTMAMAVLERTREIGILKALGARNRDIGRIFLVEAGAIGAMGGIIGLAAGALVGMVLNAVAHRMFDLPDRVALFHVSIWLAAGSVLFSMIVSILAGWLPARRAARMEPMAALRYE